MQMENSLLGMTELLMLSGSQTPDFGVVASCSVGLLKLI